MRRTDRRAYAVALATLLVAVPLAVGLASGHALTPYPPLPVAEGIAVLTNLSAPIVEAGGSGTISGTIHDPLNETIRVVSVTLEVYAFEPSAAVSSSSVPGGVPTTGSVTLSDSNASGATLVLSLPDLAANRSEGFSVDAVSAGGASAGVYAVRVGVAFAAGGTDYELRSRGYFSASAWENATSLPGNQSTLNLSRLGVSGVVPETGVQVLPPSVSPYLYGLLGAALVLAGAGGYYAARGRSKSSSGARSAPEERSAESAFGKSRTSDGD